MTAHYHHDLMQGSPEWVAARCGLLTASEMKHIVTPGKLQAADNDKTRAHLYELAAQRISGYVEPAYISDDMLRGVAEETEARHYYSTHYEPVEEVGFITNDRFGFTLGYSPDGLVGAEGLIECKSRRQRFQVQTIMEGEVPAEFVLQLQTGLMVSERTFVDFISYSGGLPLFVKRVYADETMQAAILAAAEAFEEKLQAAVLKYEAGCSAMGAMLVKTERRVAQEIYL